jgi:hypothetical protein
MLRISESSPPTQLPITCLEAISQSWQVITLPTLPCWEVLNWAPFAWPVNGIINLYILSAFVARHLVPFGHLVLVIWFVPFSEQPLADQLAAPRLLLAVRATAA